MFDALKRAIAGALFFFAGAAFAQANALSGTVTSQAEGAMEGVIVGAKRAGSTMTVSVVSDKQGRYAFPAERLEPGSYTLRVRATGLGARDLSIMKSPWPPAEQKAWQNPPPPERIPLQDGAGEVLSVGAGVTRVKPGDRVMATHYPK